MFNDREYEERFVWEDDSSKLEREYDDLVKYGKECDRKIEILKNNTNDSKMKKIGFIGLLSTLPIIFMLGSYFNTVISYFNHIYSVSLFMLCVLGVGASIGYIGQKMFTYVSKRKMREFSCAKTNEEILEELFHYEMEKEKIENKKEVIKRIYNGIVSKAKILEYYDNKISFIDKYEGYLPNKLKEKKDNFALAYKVESEELDVLTSKKFLRDKFKSFRSKNGRRETIVGASIPICGILSILLGLPLGLEAVENIVTIMDFVKCMGICFSPSLIVFPITVLYFNNRNKEHQNVFEKLNSKIGSPFLPLKENDDEKNFDDIVSNTIDQMVELGTNLRETTIAYDEMVREESTVNREKVLDNTRTKDNDNEIRLYHKENLAPFRIQSDKIGQNGKKRVRKLY